MMRNTDRFLLSQGMEDLIKQAFVSVEVIGPAVQAGHYDLIGPNGEIILPTIWEKVVQPDWNVTMMMWPPAEKGRPPGFPPHPGFDPHDRRRHHHGHGPAGPMGARMNGMPRMRPGMMRGPADPPPPPPHGGPTPPPGARVGGLHGAHPGGRGPRIPRVVQVSPEPGDRDRERRKKKAGSENILSFLSGKKAVKKKFVEPHNPFYIID
jgi:hypothetical protein